MTLPKRNQKLFSQSLNPIEIKKLQNRLEKGLPIVSKGNIDEAPSALKDYALDSVKMSKQSGDEITALIANKLTGLNKIT